MNLVLGKTLNRISACSVSQQMTKKDSLYIFYGRICLTEKNRLFRKLIIRMMLEGALCILLNSIVNGNIF